MALLLKASVFPAEKSSDTLENQVLFVILFDGGTGLVT